MSNDRYQEIRDAQAQGGGEVVQRLRGVLEHGKMGDKCLIAPDLVTAAIAALSAKKSPAEAQPVAWLVRWQHGRKRLSITIADSVAAENYYNWRNGGENNQPVELLPLYTTPPSAHVGVGYAKRLATSLWQQHYREDAPQWEPCEDLMGLLSQIDNMVSGLTRAAQQPAADPRSTHRVWRGDDWQPCYCEATNDHRIGSEQPAAADGVKCPWDEGSPCVDPRPAGMVYPTKHAPRASGYLDSSGVEWNAWDSGQMEAYARAAYSDGWEAGYRAALRDHEQEVGNG